MGFHLHCIDRTNWNWRVVASYEQHPQIRTLIRVRVHTHFTQPKNLMMFSMQQYKYTHEKIKKERSERTRRQKTKRIFGIIVLTFTLCANIKTTIPHTKYISI